jgi:hypothetical protein
VAAALATIPAVVALKKETTAPGDERTLDDVRALAWTLSSILAGAPLVTGRSHLFLQAFAVATPDRAFVRGCLDNVGLSSVDAASLAAGRVPVDDEAALARAVAPFEEHFSPAVAAAVRDWLQGPSGPVPEIVLGSKSEFYGEDRASFIDDSLTGAAERWNPTFSGKLLDLWMAFRGWSPTRRCSPRPSLWIGRSRARSPPKH